MGDRNIEYKVKELLARAIESMTDEEALQHIGVLVDLGDDLQSSEITEKAIQLLSVLDKRSLSDVNKVLRHYLLSNAYSNRIALAKEADVWLWEQADRQQQIVELRRAVRHTGFDRIGAERQCQILTNLASQLNTVGRFVEAIELWDRALVLIPNFAMALGNRGIAFLHYANALYDRGHAGMMYVAAHDTFDKAVADTAVYESVDPRNVRDWFRTQRDDLLNHFNVEDIRKSVALNGFSLGESADEQLYRKWCLENRLFLNPLNELGTNSIAARDILMLPALHGPISVLPPPYIGFFNQIKQEFVSARFSFYEGISAGGMHYSDREVLLYNTHEYPAYCLAVERMRTAFRVGYSLLDKIGNFINSYFAVGYRPNQVYFSKVWRDPPGNKPAVSQRFSNYENWPLRGLYWLSKDIYEEELQEVTEPDAQALKEVREHLEHKYLQVNQEWAARGTGKEPLQGTEALAIYRLGREELAAKTLRVLKLVRAALIYLSLAVHREEQERKKTSEPGVIVSTYPSTWEDEWKQ